VAEAQQCRGFDIAVKRQSGYSRLTPTERQPTGGDVTSRRDFLAFAAVVLVPTGSSAAARWPQQRREEKLTTVTLVIEGMT
jgi:hypothetical protein